MREENFMSAGREADSEMKSIDRRLQTKNLLLGMSLFWGGILAAQEVNLASADPGFEQKTKCWYIMKPRQYAAFAPGEGVGGSTGVKIRNDAETPVKQAGIFRKNYVEVAPGKTYTFEVDFRGQLTRGYGAAQINLFKKEGTKYHYRKTFETTRVVGDPDRWGRLHCTFTVPEGCDFLHIGLSARDFQGWMLFDNVRLTEGDGSIRIPFLKTPFAADGKWNAAFAEQALTLHDFSAYPVVGDTAAPDRTEVLLAQTADAICGVFLMHHDPAQPLKANVRKRDASVVADDSVELFITHTNAPRPYYHFIFNTVGTVYDALENNAKWNSGVKTACGKLSESCSFIQFVLPLKDIGYHAELDGHMDKLRWKMNFTRTHHRGKQALYSSFARVISFHNPEHFIVFEGLSGGRADTVSVRYWNQSLQDGAAIRRQRFWPIEKPLYKELLSSVPNPMRGESAFIWGRPIEVPQNTEFAIQYGQRYTLDLMLGEYEKNRLHPYSSSNFGQLAEWGKKTGVGVAVYAPYYMDQCAFLYDPEVNRKFLAAVRKLLEKHHEGIWGVSFGDEVLSQSLRRFVTRANQPEELRKDAALRKAVETIRNQYGSGKYGVPKSLSSEEPFAWIATRRWALDRMLETQKELTRICRSFKGCRGKDIVVISPDHVDWSWMQHQSRLAPWQDVICAQCVPLNDPARQTLAFRSKLLRDLTEKPVWLCAHVEPYSGNYTSEETAAFLSEAVRGGATGLQIWNFDYIADQRGMGSSQFDYYGHRPRWETIMDCLRRMREDNLLKYPEPEFAILVSNDTAFAHPKMRTAQPEAAFNLFGPGAGSWFRFLSDVQLLDGKAKLADWKVVVVPKANILDRRLAPQFMDYVRGGGTLLCFDPDFMGHDVSGESAADFREELFGARTVSGKAQSSIRFSSGGLFGSAAGKPLTVTRSSHFLEVAGDTEKLALFPDGKTAVSMKKYPGGGRAILTAFELQHYQSADPAWRNAARRILAGLKISGSLPIWNFLYPHKKEAEPEFPDKCLTGNNFYWWNNTVRTPGNLRLPEAWYSYSIAPDNAGGKLRCSFAEGNLTNRLKAPQAGDLANRRNRALVKSGKLHRGLFADTWKRTEPLEIVFHFGKRQIVKKAVFFWNGSLPDFTVRDDAGKAYPVRGGKTAGVERAEVVLPSLRTETLTVRIPERGKGEHLLLSEVEIWGGECRP